MPKKFKGENSKAVEARARKAAVQKEVQEKKKKELEDEYWRDDDKHCARKQQRKDDKEKKRQEQLEKKREKEQMLEEEMASLKTNKPQPMTKVTRLEIETHKEKLAAQAAAEKTKEPVIVTELPLETNVNLMHIEGEDARNIDEALSVLSFTEEQGDKHPEKRMKAAFTAYQDKNLPILKAENPHMRLSQLKQMLKKDWMKSPENPMNQKLAAFNAKR